MLILYDMKWIQKFKRLYKLFISFFIKNKIKTIIMWEMYYLRWVLDHRNEDMFLKRGYFGRSSLSEILLQACLRVKTLF